jgi:hypothetical protein
MTQSPISRPYVVAVLRHVFRSGYKSGEDVEEGRMGSLDSWVDLELHRDSGQCSLHVGVVLRGDLPVCHRFLNQ